MNSCSSSANIASALIRYLFILVHCLDFIEVAPALSARSKPEVKVRRGRVPLLIGFH